MIPLLPALLLLLMQGSLNGDALEGRVQQLWLARLTGHSAHLDQVDVEEAIAALLTTSCQSAGPAIPAKPDAAILPSGRLKDSLLPSSAPRDGPKA